MPTAPSDVKDDAAMQAAHNVADYLFQARGIMLIGAITEEGMASAISASYAPTHDTLRAENAGLRRVMVDVARDAAGLCHGDDVMQRIVNGFATRLNNALKDPQP